MANLSPLEFVGIVALGVVLGLLAWRLIPYALGGAVVVLPIGAIVYFFWGDPERLAFLGAGILVAALWGLVEVKWLEPWRVRRKREQNKDPDREAAFQALVDQYAEELNAGKTPAVRG